MHCALVRRVQQDLRCREQRQYDTDRLACRYGAIRSLMQVSDKMYHRSQN